jgi:catechol 2,3-dioxygenase-like lactoylglutathione lyase family enzyme
MPPNQFNLSAPDYVILIVEDLDRALRFYVNVLGLQLGHRSGDYAQLDTGATRLALYTRSARRVAPVSSCA